MVDGHERRLVEERDLPELLRVVEQEPPVRRPARASPSVDEQPLARVRAREVDAVVEEADRRAPERVGDEAPDARLAVQRVDERARALELLDFLHDASSPSGRRGSAARRSSTSARTTSAFAPRAEADVRRQEAHGPRDVEVPRLDLDEAADAAAVHLPRARRRAPRGRRRASRSRCRRR